MIEKSGIGYWLRDYDPKGNVIAETPLELPNMNLTPNEGLNLMLNVLFRRLAAPVDWYVGLYDGLYIPNEPDISAATLQARASEVLVYESPTRPVFTPSGPPQFGTFDNSASLCTFIFNAPVKVQGVFMSSSPAKGSSTGTLLSIAKFPSPRDYAVGSKAEVFASPFITSLV